MTAVTQLLQRIDASADALVLDLNQLDVAQCDLEHLAVVSAVRTKLTARLACLDADIARRRAELSRVVGERPVDHAVDPNQQRSAAQEKSDIDRAEVLDQFPGVDDATRAGDIPATYADGIARAMKRLSESQRAEFRRRHQNLHELAQSMSLHRFRLRVKDLVTTLLAEFGVDHTVRQRRDRCVRMWTDIETGMGHIHAQLDPETYARVTNAITKRTDRLYHTGRDDRGDTRSRDQLTADALTELILATAGDGVMASAVRPGTNLTVLVDYDTLTNGLHEHGVCTTSNGVDLPVAEVRRRACEANIIPIVLDSHGVVLDEGRFKRLATDEQRLALRAMYATCAINGCDIPFDQCDIHHLKPWEPPANGETNLDNLRPLCTAGPNHHAQWHRNGWTGHVHPETGDLIITYRDGTTEHHPLPRQHAA